MVLNHRLALASAFGVLGAMCTVVAGSCAAVDTAPVAGGDAVGPCTTCSWPDERDLPSPEAAALGCGLHDPQYPALPTFTEGWAHVLWNPECALYQPASAEALAAIPKIVWEPCASGRPGCRQLAFNWSNDGSATIREFSATVAPSGATRIAFSRVYTPYQSESVIWDEDKGIVAAWRYNGLDCCIVKGFGDISTGAIVYTTLIRTAVEHVRDYFQIVGQPDELRAKTIADYRFTSEDIGSLPFVPISQSNGNADLVTMYFGISNKITIRDRASNKMSVLTWDAGQYVIGPTQSIVGDAVLYSRTAEVDVWSHSLGERTLIHPTSAFAHDVTSDGSAIAWIESSAPNGQGFFQSSTLYASPFTTDARGVLRRRLADDICPTAFCGTKMSGGYVVVGSWPVNPTPDTSYRLIARLADGAVWRIAPVRTPTYNEGWGLGGVVVRDELWQPWGDLDRQRGSLQRIAVSSLGGPNHD